MYCIILYFIYIFAIQITLYKIIAVIMKKVIDISLGGSSFSMEEDAYYMLRDYLDRFEKTMSDRKEAEEVMEDVELRVAEIFQKELKYPGQAVNVSLVKVVINHLGELEKDSVDNNYSEQTEPKAAKRLYLDQDDKKLGGVCSGLAIYLGIDATVVRIIFLILFFGYGTGLIAYIIFWIVTPKALTIPQKLEMRGIPVTAENIKRYSSQKF